MLNALRYDSCTRGQRAVERLFPLACENVRTWADSDRPGFLDPLDTIQLPDGRMQLQAPLRYRPRRVVPSLGTRELVEVPVGFTTDFDSTPLLLPGIVRVTFRRQLDNARASALHDFLYWSQIVSRSEADALFAEALALTGESWLGAAVMWSGVRVGGWLPWRRHARAQTRAAVVPIDTPPLDPSFAAA